MDCNARTENFGENSDCRKFVVSFFETVFKDEMFFQAEDDEDQPVLKKKKRGRKKKTECEDPDQLDEPGEEKPKKKRGRPKGSGLGLGLGEGENPKKDENGEVTQEDLFDFPQDESLRDPAMRHQCDRCVRGFMLKPEFHQVRSRKAIHVYVVYNNIVQHFVL